MTTSVLAAGTPSPSDWAFARHGWQVSWLAVLITFAIKVTSGPSHLPGACGAKRGGRFVDIEASHPGCFSHHSSGFSVSLRLRPARTLRTINRWLCETDEDSSPLYSRGVGCDQGALVGSTLRIPYHFPEPAFSTGNHPYLDVF